MADIQVQDLFSVKGLVALVTGGGTGESFSFLHFIGLGFKFGLFISCCLFLLISCSFSFPWWCYTFFYCYIPFDYPVSFFTEKLRRIVLFICQDVVYSIILFLYYFSLFVMTIHPDQSR